MLLFANDGSKLRKLSSKYDSYRLERAINSRLEYEKYINTVQNTNDEKVLKDIALNMKESDKLVCLAIEKIDNKQYLIDIINNCECSKSNINYACMNKFNDVNDFIDLIYKTNSRTKSNTIVQDYVFDNLNKEDLIIISNKLLKDYEKFGPSSLLDEASKYATDKNLVREYQEHRECIRPLRSR